jgi:hypothetical protein
MNGLSARTCSFATLKLTVKIRIQITLRKLRCSIRNNVITVTQDGFALQNVTVIGRSETLWRTAQLTSHSSKNLGQHHTYKTN